VARWTSTATSRPNTKPQKYTTKFDALTDKLDRQVLKYKEKVSDHNRDKRIATE